MTGNTFLELENLIGWSEEGLLNSGANFIYLLLFRRNVAFGTLGIIVKDNMITLPVYYILLVFMTLHCYF